jgi:chromosome segregation ATPase
MLGLSSKRRTTLAEDQELIALVEQRFADLAERIDESRNETRQRLDGIETETRQRFDRLEGQDRQNGVEIEALRGDVRQVAEGVATLDEKLERFRIDSERQFDEMRAMIHLSYGQLEKRLVTLECRCDDLEARLTALEAGRN